MRFADPAALVARLAPIALAVAAVGARAQVMEDVELRREGADAIVVVRFNVPVQYRRAVAASSNDLVQIVYDVVPSRDKPRFIEGERRTIGGDGIPRLTITEEGGSSGELDRRLVVRLVPPAKFKVRGGADRRSIEVVLEGLGATAFGAAPKPAAAAPTPAPITPAAVAAPASLDAQVEARGAELMAQAREALAKGQNGLAVESLNEALNLPPNSHTREAQALIAQARLADGDLAGTRRELELFLQLYPEGPDADQARIMLAGLPAGAATPTAGTAEATPERKKDNTMLIGALSQYYYGGNSKTRTQLKDTPLEGQIPVVISEDTLDAIDQKQLLTSVDVNWRMKDEDRDLRFVFRDAFTNDFMPDRPDENRLSALYFDWKETGPGLSARLGRQSGLGGGVLGRFDGALLGWSFVPKWKINVVAGQPTEKLLDTRRQFYGASLDAEAIVPGLGASAYAIQQTIDGEVDRRAVGADIRFFQPGVSVFSQFEYDTTLQGINIASVQGTWTSEDNTVVNVLYDRRATPMLMLGNALFFPDPNIAVMPRRLQDLLAAGKTLELLRQQVVDTTAYSTQGLLGVTTPLNPHWQIGADLRMTSVGAILPVPGILPEGIPATGEIWTGSLQAIGTNLYSERDTHVFNLTAVKGPTYTGWLASYNHLSVLSERWQLEPSLRFYQQDGPNGVQTTRWSPGLRVTWRGGEKWVVESDMNVEASDTKSAQQNENSTRLYYSLGYRLDF
ncbi:outer membrane protein assembly factor BamD [Ideonella sp.]|uniref:outer membrane protein assembly factor BamD n=1 Tax=Ideonella sp. TaxID=1929293 RepID=UPI002B4AACEA|nr:outer membrane protein assembly factor BamD [Ideonella sp.]HJV68687.1 outer membrane protein assembly factor BamD [Ideonella sp.]